MRLSIKILLAVLPSIFSLYGIFFLNWDVFGIVLFYIIETGILSLFYILQQLTRKLFNSKVKISQVIIFGLVQVLFCSLQIFFNIVAFYGERTSAGRGYFDDNGTLDILIPEIQKLQFGIYALIIMQIMSIGFFVKQKEYKYTNYKYSKIISGLIFARTFLGQVIIVVSCYLSLDYGRPDLGIIVLILFQILSSVIGVIKLNPSSELPQKILPS